MRLKNWINEILLTRWVFAGCDVGSYSSKKEVISLLHWMWVLYRQEDRRLKREIPTVRDLWDLAENLHHNTVLFPTEKEPREFLKRKALFHHCYFTSDRQETNQVPAKTDIFFIVFLDTGKPERSKTPISTPLHLRFICRIKLQVGGILEQSTGWTELTYFQSFPAAHQTCKLSTSP